MTDIEVYVHDDELDQDVWKRVFIGGSPETADLRSETPESHFRGSCADPRGRELLHSSAPR